MLLVDQLAAGIEPTACWKESGKTQNHVSVDECLPEYLSIGTDLPRPAERIIVINGVDIDFDVRA